MSLSIKKMAHPIVFALIVIGGIMLLNKGSAFAATKTWVGDGADGNFSTSGNWSPAGAPTDGDDLVFDLSDLGTQETPINDVVGLSIASITVDNAAEGELFTIIFEEDTTLTGDVTNTGDDDIEIAGGFILGGDVTLSGGVDLASQSGSLNEVTLGGNTLTVSDFDGITAMGIPITGSGVVNYENLGQVQIEGENTYSGTTNFTDVIQTINSSSAPNSPEEMFGTSAITVDESSRVELEFSSSETFSNQITLSATTVTDSTFHAQLNFSSEQVSASHEITLPNVVLSGDAGMTLVPSQIASVNLNGIEDNDNCLYVPTSYEDYFLNAPTFCDGDSTSSVDDVPGVPDTGVAGKSYRNQLTALASLVGVAVVAAYVVKRRISSKA